MSSIVADRTATGIVGAESVVYGVEDLVTSHRFFEDFGLTTIEHGQHGATLETLERTTIQLRGSGDASLPAAKEEGSTLREIVWGVDTKEHLQALATDLARDRPVVTGPDGTVHTVDEDGYGMAFTLTQRTPVRLEPQSLNTVGEAVRRNEPARLYERATPAHIGHILLYCLNYEEQLAFYTNRLGFMVSDTLREFGAFLRCCTDHHNLFLLKHHRTGLNHVSFGVQGLDEIMGGFGMLTRQGWEPVWGLGRHYLGSNLFYYFRNPAGAYIEYYADLDCITNPELWEPRDWDPQTPEALFAWGGWPPVSFLDPEE